MCLQDEQKLTNYEGTPMVKQLIEFGKREYEQTKQTYNKFTRFIKYDYVLI